MSSQPAHARAQAPPRRTVTITGRPERAVPRRLRLVEESPAADPRPRRLVEVQRRRPPRSAAERLGPRPDRIAMWAVFMALFLILVVLLSG